MPITNEQAAILLLLIYIAAMQDCIDRFCDHKSSFTELRQYRGK